jgi:glycosyltransferase involved in cell wall biosynthesis
MDAARCTVIICAYADERWGDLNAAVASVQGQIAPPGEIIVVIDHNPALLARANAQLASVTVVANERERGLSGARNSGLAVARGDVIAFLDDDAIAEPDWLVRLCAGYRDPAALGIGGAIEPLWTGGQAPWFPAEFGWVVGCSYRGMPGSTATVRNLIGANMSLRREVFAVVGDFSGALGRVGSRPVGCEETELCIRARQHWPGRFFLYEPRARVHHRVPAARVRWRYFLARCYAEGLSKAQVVRLVGPDDGLATERTYTFRTLPQGVLRGLADGLWRRDAAGFARAAAIVAGLAATTLGYWAGTVVGWAAGRRAAAGDISGSSVRRRGGVVTPSAGTD